MTTEPKELVAAKVEIERLRNALRASLARERESHRARLTDEEIETVVFPHAVSQREIGIDELPLTVTCQKCGKSRQLWFNGGELDRADCHGTVWTLKHDRIVLVTEER